MLRGAPRVFHSTVTVSGSMLVCLLSSQSGSTHGAGGHSSDGCGWQATVNPSGGVNFHEAPTP